MAFPKNASPELVEMLKRQAILDRPSFSLINEIYGLSDSSSSSSLSSEEESSEFDEEVSSSSTEKIPTKRIRLESPEPGPPEYQINSPPKYQINGPSECLTILYGDSTLDRLTNTPFHGPFHCHSINEGGRSIQESNEWLAPIFEEESRAVRLSTKFDAEEVAQITTQHPAVSSLLLVIDIHRGIRPNIEQLINLLTTWRHSLVHLRLYFHAIHYPHYTGVPDVEEKAYYDYNPYITATLDMLIVSFANLSALKHLLIVHNLQNFRKDFEAHKGRIVPPDLFFIGRLETFYYSGPNSGYLQLAIITSYGAQLSQIGVNITIQPNFMGRQPKDNMTPEESGYDSTRLDVPWIYYNTVGPKVLDKDFLKKFLKLDSTIAQKCLHFLADIQLTSDLREISRKFTSLVSLDLTEIKYDEDPFTSDESASFLEVTRLLVPLHQLVYLRLRVPHYFRKKLSPAIATLPTITALDLVLHYRNHNYNVIPDLAKPFTRLVSLRIIDRRWGCLYSGGYLNCPSRKKILDGELPAEFEQALVSEDNIYNKKFAQVLGRCLVGFLKRFKEAASSYGYAPFRAIAWSQSYKALVRMDG